MQCGALADLCLVARCQEGGELYDDDDEHDDSENDMGKEPWEEEPGFDARGPRLLASEGLHGSGEALKKDVPAKRTPTCSDCKLKRWRPRAPAEIPR